MLPPPTAWPHAQVMPKALDVKNLPGLFCLLRHLRRPSLGRAQATSKAPELKNLVTASTVLKMMNNGVAMATPMSVSSRVIRVTNSNYANYKQILEKYQEKHFISLIRVSRVIHLLRARVTSFP